MLAAGRRATGWVAGGVVLILVAWRWLVLVRDTPGDLAFDFRQFWQGARDVVNGVSPYPSPELLATAGDYLDSVGIQEVFRFPYPAGAAVALAPFGLLDFELAAVLWSILLVAAIVGALRVLGVRDWRAYFVALSSAPIMSAIHLGTLTPVLVLLAAAVWRWRDRAVVAGGALALAVSLKLFLWPLVLWLMATRRYAAAAIASSVALLFTLAAWAAIGLVGLSDYPELLRRLSDVVADRGYSFVALGNALALPEAASRALPWAAGLAVLGYAVALARRGEVGERGTFSLALVATIVLTPIVWLHSFALLVVPLALAYPRIAWAWGLMWAFWVIPAQESDGALWRVLLAAAVVVAILWVSARPSRAAPVS